ncbi:MAG: hypothetical protein K2Y21_00055 [Phycisphaerales bacterium]|nr:hypothetical protein [Phycisphaerales bacterium]
MRNTLAPAALVATMIAGLTVGLAHADLEIVSITPRAHGSSVLTTTLGTQSFLDTITTGTYPSFIGSLPGALTSGTSTVQCAADYTLFLTNTQIIANGFADSSVTAGAGFLSGSAIAQSSIEIVFNIDGPHHVELHSIESQSSNAGGAAVLTHNEERHEVFRYEHNHVHGVVYNLEAGNYTLLLNADTASDFATGGAQSVAFYEIEFELFEGSACRCDLNADNQVDDADFVVFAAAYNDLICPPPPRPASNAFTDRHAGCPADFDGNSVVDDADFLIFAQAYNELVCP